MIAAYKLLQQAACLASSVSSLCVIKMFLKRKEIMVVVASQQRGTNTHQEDKHEIEQWLEDADSQFGQMCINLSDSLYLSLLVLLLPDIVIYDLDFFDSVETRSWECCFLLTLLLCSLQK